MMLKLLAGFIIALAMGIGALTPNIALAQESVEAGFRVGPTVRLRPLNDTIKADQDGLVELFFSNPSVNDVTLNVDVSIQVPSGMHIYGEGFGTAAAAGVVQGFFETPPGTSRTIFLNITSEKVGDFFVHFSGIYWPGDNKDRFQPLSLTAPISVQEKSAAPDDPQVADAGNVVQQAQQEQSAPSGGSGALTATVENDDPVWKTLLPLWYVLGSMLGIAVIIFLGRTVITTVNE